MNAKLVIALDVGGSTVKSGMVAYGAERPVTTSQTLIDSKADAGTIINTLSGIIRSYLPKAVPLAGIASGFPGPFDYDGGISLIAGVDKFDALYGLNIRDALQEQLALPTLPIFFFNDAQVAVLGEVRFGAGRGYQRVLGITLGTGLGSTFTDRGICVVRGNTVPPNGYLYNQTFNGTPADEVFSTRGLQARFKQLSGTDWTVVDAVDAVRKGELRLHNSFRQFGVELGNFLRPYTQTFGAEAVLILGGISAASDLFLPEVRSGLSIPVLTGQLGSDAALMGLSTQFFLGWP